MSGQNEQDTVAIEWKHSATYDDWTLNIPLPQGSIKGSIAFTNPYSKTSHTVWGIIEVRIPGHELQKTALYDTPPEGVDNVSREVMAVMTRIIAELMSTG